MGDIDKIKLVVFVEFIVLVVFVSMSFFITLTMENLIDAMLMFLAASVVSVYILSPLLDWFMDW